MEAVTFATQVQQNMMYRVIHRKTSPTVDKQLVTKNKFHNYGQFSINIHNFRSHSYLNKF